MGLLGAADRGQRRFTPLGFPIATIYKFMDDQGNYLAAVITYYAFIAIFPLLLLASTVLGFILAGRPELQEQVLNSALAQFPIVGDRLGRPEELQGSTTGVIIGSIAALYGSLGLGQAIQNTINTAWSVPRNSRPNPPILRIKSLALLVTAGLAVLAISIASAVGSTTQMFGTDNGALQWLIRLATFLAVGGVLTLLFRLAAARQHHLGWAAPGAFATALMWQALQQIGTVYASTVVSETNTMTNTFGLVLGLIGIIYLAAVMGVLGIEVNVVLARRLWPRALMTLFTDKVDLTDADRRAYASYAQRERHKGFETVAVTFEDKKSGGTHEFPLPVLGSERPPRKERHPVRKTRAQRVTEARIQADVEADLQKATRPEPEQTQPIRLPDPIAPGERDG